MRVRHVVPLVTAAVVVAAGLAAATAAAAAPLASVAGFVRGDAQPLAGVVVSAVVNPDGSPDDQQTLGQTVTAADGSYRLAIGIADVEMFFDASAVVGGTSPTGYASQCYGGTTGCWLGGTLVYLRPGPPSKVSISLPHAAEIRGRVTDKAGRSIANEPVAVYDGSLGEDRSPVPYRTGRTDLNGNYLLPDLVPFGYQLVFGNVQVHATAPDPDGYVISAPAGGGTVRAGQIRTVNATLVGNGGFSGRVVDQAGVPVAGATVATDDLISTGFFPEYAATETARNGTFRLGALAPGTHEYCVSKPGYTAICDTVTYPYRVTITEDATTRVPTVALRLTS